MGYEFEEYKGSFMVSPKMVVEIVDYLSKVFSKYLKDNKSKYSKIEYGVVTKVIKDALSNVFSMVNKNKSLRVKDVELDGNYLITLLWYSFSQYSFSNEKNTSKELGFDNKQIANILVDFLNYFTQLSGCDRIFTMKDLYDNYIYQEYMEDMMNLKLFLSRVDYYYTNLLNGVGVDDMIKRYFHEKGIERISKGGTVYYSKEYKEEYSIRNAKMSDQQAKFVLMDVDAIICAYYKCIYSAGWKNVHGMESIKESKNKLVYRRIKTMKDRDETSY